MENGPLLIHLSDQMSLDLILDPDTEHRTMVDKMNEEVEKFGKLIMEEKWEQAVKMIERKTNFEGRKSLILRLQSFLTNEHGPIQNVKIGGTIPYPDYLAMTLLLFVTEDGFEAGIPIIWNDSDEILGFRPLLTQHTLSFLACYDGNIITGYYPQIDKVVTMEPNFNSRTLEIQKRM